MSETTTAKTTNKPALAKTATKREKRARKPTGTGVSKTSTHGYLVNEHGFMASIQAYRVESVKNRELYVAWMSDTRHNEFVEAGVAFFPRFTPREFDALEVARTRMIDYIAELQKKLAGYERGIVANRVYRDTQWLRCSACHARHENVDHARFGSWRWNGAYWEHACANRPIPQAGHMAAEMIPLDERSDEQGNEEGRDDGTR